MIKSELSEDVKNRIIKIYSLKAMILVFNDILDVINRIEFVFNRNRGRKFGWKFERYI